MRGYKFLMYWVGEINKFFKVEFMFKKINFNVVGGKNEIDWFFFLIGFK